MWGVLWSLSCKEKIERLSGFFRICLFVNVKLVRDQMLAYHIIMGTEDYVCLSEINYGNVSDYVWDWDLIMVMPLKIYSLCVFLASCDLPSEFNHMLKWIKMVLQFVTQLANMVVVKCFDSKGEIKWCVT